MIHHASLGVSDLAASRRFYDAALAPLGLARILDFGAGADAGGGRGSDYGAEPHPYGVELTITVEAGLAARPPPYPGVHLCFRAPTRAAVAEFHAAALTHGGRDDGAPGPRPHYGESYYAAFVHDPDGHRIEAVCLAPEAPHVRASDA
jgi:catechol 2,3-dioxygenase-like lactoylglutathione lyase family enzyme